MRTAAADAPGGSARTANAATRAGAASASSSTPYAVVGPPRSRSVNSTRRASLCSTESRSKPPVCSRNRRSAATLRSGWYCRAYAARRAGSALLNASSQAPSAAPAAVPGSATAAAGTRRGLGTRAGREAAASAAAASASAATGAGMRRRRA
jgi:hypothetical protein